jgi:hypothetical protein
MKLTTAALAVIGTLFVSVQVARADTYLVVINSLNEDIKVNNVAVVPGAGAWSALTAVVEAPGGSRYSVKDISKKCSDGGWEIQSQGAQSSSYCIALGFGEVGCLFAFVRDNGGVAHIEMEKVALGNCSSNWWSQAGRDTVKELAEEVRKTASSVAEVIAAKNGVAK